jgi:hypothetical protein
VDIERAAIAALQTVFPPIEIKLCYYHFANTLWKKAKTLNMNLIMPSFIIQLLSGYIQGHQVNSYVEGNKNSLFVT